MLGGCLCRFTFCMLRWPPSKTSESSSQSMIPSGSGDLSRIHGSLEDQKISLDRSPLAGKAMASDSDRLPELHEAGAVPSRGAP